MQQELNFSSPGFYLDGRVDYHRPWVQYIGHARKDWMTGTWRCLANVDGALCVVEVKITPEPR